MYSISRGQIRLTNKIYNSTCNDYEILLPSDSKIEKCYTTIKKVPEVEFAFKTIEELHKCKKGTIIDTIAVCKKIGIIENIASKSSGREFRKREIILMDHTGEIILTLWNETAETEIHEEQSIISIKNGVLHEFQRNKTISTSNKTTIRKNPEVKEALLLKKLKR